MLVKWYKQRREGREIPPPRDNQDYSHETIEKIEGGYRTTTFFPERAFLSIERQREVAKQAHKELGSLL